MYLFVRVSCVLWDLLPKCKVAVHDGTCESHSSGEVFLEAQHCEMPCWQPRVSSGHCRCCIEAIDTPSVPITRKHGVESV